MRIIFIRHGNPDYAQDCLTELGHIQAEAAAEVLCTMGIEKIYSSSHGRAVQTAKHTAKKLGYEIYQCDFMREITANPKDPSRQYGIDCSPWTRSREYKNRNLPLNDSEWKNHELFSDVDTPESVERIRNGLDEWLHSLGIEREGLYYRINEPIYDTVAMFCHVGSYASAASRLFNLAFPFTFLTLLMPQTGISVIEFKGEKGELVAPRICVSGNVDHLIKNNIEIT